MVPLSFSGCLGSGQKAPQGSQEEMLRQYREDYEDQRPEAGDNVPAPPAAQVDSLEQTTESRQIVLRDGAALPDSLRRGPGRNSTFVMVEGEPEYRIGVGDVLKITSFIEPQPTEASLPVQQDGTIYFPRFDLGYIQAAGMSPSQLAEALMLRVREYVPAAHFDVEVELYGAWRATLAGEILIRTRPETGPGRFSLKGITTASQFIFDHGGPTTGASLSDVRVVRDETTIHLDLSGSLLGEGGNQDLILDDGDFVMVPSQLEGSDIFYVLGEVNRPGTYPLTRRSNVMDAIAQAGSFTQFADAEAVFIGRNVDGQGQTVPITVSTIVRGEGMSRDMILRPGDYVIVPRRAPTFWERARDWIVLTTLVVNVLVIIWYAGGR
jgi:polysaccharide export outer membrane protein